MITKLLIYASCLSILWLWNSHCRSVTSRQTVFLIASYGLYAIWGPWFLPILLITSLMNYFLGSYLKRCPTPGRLWIGIVPNLALLSLFKYLPPLAATVAPHSTVGSTLSHIVFPVGISFWIFQALSYLFDIYRGQDLDPSVKEFCLYMAFWPTVLSGPICRLGMMLPQFREQSRPSWTDVGSGTQRIFIGALMMGIAQLLGAGVRIGGGVNWGFDHAVGWGGLDVWCLVFGFGFQLFFDFAGYSHLAIGAAQVFGIRLQENFDRPFLSTTPSAFWTRWHMSLSSWIRDYVFLPLATATPHLWWRNLALAISMVIFGLWHKGSVLFILWGSYHGVLLVLHRQWQQLRRRFVVEWSGSFSRLLSWTVSFATISMGWIFFRAHDWTIASSMLKAIFSPSSYRRTILPPALYLLVCVAAFGYFGVIASVSFLDHREATFEPGSSFVSRILGAAARNRWVWVAPLLIVTSIYIVVVLQPETTSASPFLYRLF